MATRAVLLANPAQGEHRAAELRRQSQEVELSFKLVDPRDNDDAVIAACDGAAILMAPAHPRTQELACRIPGLKLVQTFSAGTEGLDKARLLNHGVRVANNGGANAVCVAELAVWLIVTIYHKLDLQIESVRAGHWNRDVHGDIQEFRTLADKRVGVVGLGRIGTQVARRLGGWDCEVVYHDVVDFDAEYETRAGAKQVPFDELLATSDIVTLHVPLDRTTRGMMSTPQFEAMKSTAVLVNTCRGPVVDETALTAALKGGLLHGFGADVTEVEPIDPESELITLPNVVITPHLGGRAVECSVNATRNAVVNAERIARGEEPLWVVDPV